MQLIASTLPSHANRDSAVDQPRRKAYVLPGKLLVTARPTAIKTNLGSCVAVCAFDASRRIGGLVHFVLPQPLEPGASTLRYGDFAINHLVSELLRRGATRSNLRAKLFGGAQVLSPNRGRSRPLGERNVHLAENELARHGIPIVARQTGGNSARMLVFWSDDGSAWVKALR